MSLAVGARIGPYEVVSPLGAGGMGEVYRARDTKLNRDVALKVLTEEFAADPDRLIRATREAQTLAILNHPNIAQIYGFEESDGIRALVMELVEGEDLSRRLASGPIPIDEALGIARQVADALEAAHVQRIVHRDLKPANIKVRSDGTVKVLDFGLAKPVGPVASALTDTPTEVAGVTRAGVIVGTLAYMSPEQARGKAVDSRTDLWAFGCVLYEMLAGRPAFRGETASDVLAAILERDPEWAALPLATPALVRRLIARCLQKDVRQRWRDIGDARLEIDDLIAGELDNANPEAAASERRVGALALAGGLVAGAAIAAAATWTLRAPVSSEQPPMRFAITAPLSRPFASNGFNRNLALSPDGTHIIYVSSGGQLMMRAIDRLDAIPLAGITGADSPFVSPDGRWVGFFTGATGELKKVSIAGGPPLLICRYHGTSGGASWGPEDTIVFATNDPSTGLMRVAATGGDATVLTTPDRAQGESDHLFPSVLGNGEAVLFTTTRIRPAEAPQVTVFDVKTRQRRPLIHGGGAAEYVAPGHVAYVEGGALRTVRFDPVRRELAGDPITVVDQVMTTVGGAAEFSVSRQGALLYVPGGSPTGTRSLAWFDRHGNEEPIAVPQRPYVYPRLSPDGSRVALDIRDQENDIWIWDFSRQTLTRLTIDPAIDQYPVWTPDSHRVIFASTRAGSPNLFWQSADNTGTVERLTTGSNNQYPTSISPDGTQLIFRENTSNAGAYLHVLSLGPTPTDATAGSQRIQSLMQIAHRDDNGELSPNGHFLAYQSADSGAGQNEIYVRPFPNYGAGLWQVSTNGGTKPVWARNGQELFFLDANDAMTVVSVQTASSFSAGAPTRLFGGTYYAASAGRTYDISPDGKKFLMIKSANAGGSAGTPATMVVVLNWLRDAQTRAGK
jgi:hypothetical protein